MQVKFTQVPERLELFRRLDDEIGGAAILRKFAIFAACVVALLFDLFGVFA
jgi:hypothetical protein